MSDLQDVELLTTVLQQGEAQGASWVTTIFCWFIQVSNVFKWIPCFMHIISAAFLKLHQI